MIASSVSAVELSIQLEVGNQSCYMTGLVLSRVKPCRSGSLYRLVIIPGYYWLQTIYYNIHVCKTSLYKLFVFINSSFFPSIV